MLNTSTYKRSLGLAAPRWRTTIQRASWERPRSLTSRRDARPASALLKRALDFTNTKDGENYRTGDAHAL
jgi:hypothetical protein